MHSSYPLACTSEAWATERNALELCGCIRLCAAGGGANVRVQDQQLVVQNALSVAVHDHDMKHLAIFSLLISYEMKVWNRGFASEFVN